MLELELIEFSESLRAFEIGWLSFFLELDIFAEGLFQKTLDQIDREIGDLNHDPLSAELLRGVNRRPASAKWVENDIAGIGRSAYNAFEKSLRFLCRVTETLLSLRTDCADITPEVLKLNSRMLVSV